MVLELVVGGQMQLVTVVVAALQDTNRRVVTTGYLSLTNGDHRKIEAWVEFPMELRGNFGPLFFVI